MRSSSLGAVPFHVSPRTKLFIIIGIAAALFGASGCSDDGPMRQTLPSPSPEWQVMPTRTDVTLRGVWGSSDADVFAVGDNGTILHFDGFRWSAMSSPTVETLRGVSGTAPDNVYAGGDNGTALHYDGSAWTELDPRTSNHLGTVRAWRDYAAFADRSSPGVIRVYDGGIGLWTTDDTGTGAVINDIRWIPRLDEQRPLTSLMFLAGEAGAGFYNQAGWRPLEAGSADLVSVFGTAPGNAFVLDAAGVLWHFRGRAEGIAVANAGAAMATAAQRAYDDILLFGAAGRIFRFDRCELTEVRSNVTADFLSAWVAPGGEVFAVGEHGTILRYRETPARHCPDNVIVRIGAGDSPTVSWSPPCPVSKLMVTALEGPDQANWFIAADGNHIESGLRIGEVPECATEVRPRLGAMEAGQLYRLTLIRRDVEGDLAVGFYNFRAGAGPQTLAAESGGAMAAASAPEGVYAQPVALIVQPQPGQPLIMEFTTPERWRWMESFVDGVTPVDAVVRALVRDPDTGEVRIVQLDDVPVAQIGDSYAVDWPHFTE